MTAITPKEVTWPVVEIFGPTIQGEGVDQGVAAHFVRFGGCDYRCSWCDTPHAVIPAEVRRNAQRMTAEDIGEACRARDNSARSYVPWIILTGGNPALHDLGELVTELHASGYLVAVETQGSRWRNWMGRVDRLCVSPKPPSSGMASVKHEDELQRFLHEGMKARAVERPYEWLFLKIPIFNHYDLNFAERTRLQLSDTLLYLSAGNDAGRTVGEPERRDERSRSEVRNHLCDQFEWLVNEVLKRPHLCVPDVICQLQSHVLAWGNEIGH